MSAIYDKSQDYIESPPLAVTSKSIIQRDVLHYETQILQTKVKVDQFVSDPKSAWEEFVFKRALGGEWIIQEWKMRLNIQAWRRISKTLSSDEMHILERWALQHQEQFRGVKVSLPDFRTLN
jgi:hypothetical protein